MKVPEYTDLYKFLVSLGLIIVGSAAGLAWYAFREPFNTLIATSELQSLTTEAQSLIAWRQATGLWLVENVAWLSGGLVFIGLVVFGRGVYLWNKNQAKSDELVNIDLEQQRRKLRDATPAAIAQQAALEVQAEISDEGGDSQGTTPSDLPDFGSRVTAALSVEEEVIKHIHWCFNDSVVYSHQAMWDNPDSALFEFDAVVIPASDKPDVLFEIKYVRRLVKRQIIGFVQSFALRVSMYLRQPRIGQTSSIIIFIVEDSAIGDSRREEYQRLSEELGMKSYPNVQALVISRLDLPNFPCDQVKRLVWG